MKTKFMKFAGTLLVCFSILSPLAAQNATSLESDTNTAVKYSEALTKQKLEIDKDLEKTRLDNQKEIEKNRQDNEKAMSNSMSDNHRLIIHDLAWNSWVLFVIAVFFFGYLRDKRRHETIRLMIEKGTPITPEILDGLRKKPRLGRASYDPNGYLCWGITETLVAIALLFSFQGGAGRTAGYIVLAVGVANLILFVIDRLFSHGGQSK